MIENIMLIKNSLPKDFCKEILNRKPTSEKICDAKEGESTFGTTVDWSIYDEDVVEIINKRVGEYIADRKLYDVPMEYYHHSSIIQESLGDLRLHVDLEWERQVDYITHFTPLTSLNGDDVEGGELYFPRQNKSFKFETGDTIIFPIGIFYPHGVTGVTNGQKRYMFKSLYTMNLLKFDEDDGLDKD